MNRWLKRIANFITILAGFCLLFVACGSSEDSSSTKSAVINTNTDKATEAYQFTNIDQITDTDRAEIYSLIVRKVAHEDDTHGGKLNPEVIYIQGFLKGLSIADVISPDIRDGVSSRLDSLESEVMWIDSWEEALDPDTGTVLQNGAIITIGDIYLQDDGYYIQVVGEIYVANMAAGGQTYVLTYEDGLWVIVGTTGIFWIS